MQTMQILYISIMCFAIIVLNVCDPGDILALPGYGKHFISGDEHYLIGLMTDLLTGTPLETCDNLFLLFTRDCCSSETDQ